MQKEKILFTQWITPISQQQDRMESLLIDWSAINSGSYNLEGLQRMKSVLQKHFGQLAPCKEVKLKPKKWLTPEGTLTEQPSASLLHFRVRPEVPFRILLNGHMDTVFPKEHPFQSARRVGEDTLVGPGVCDLKGGLVTLLIALEAFEASPFAQNIGWDLVINPDEEIGSCASSEPLFAIAKQCNVGLVFEPSLPDGSFVSARKGSANYSLVIFGQSAHAGRDFEKGRNVIYALGELLPEIKAITSGGTTLNIATLEAPAPVNTIPDRLSCRINIRSQTQEELKEADNKLKELFRSAESKTQDFRFVLHRDSWRNPKPFDPKTKHLFELVKSYGEELGLDLNWQTSGGVCDGNLIAEAGIPTIDTLGVQGGKMHTEEEFTILSSLTTRAQLITLTLINLAHNPGVLDV